MHLAGVCTRIFIFISLVFGLARVLPAIAEEPSGTVPDATLRDNSKVPNDLKEIGIQEHLGEQVSINDLTFRNEEGSPVQLKEFFKSGRPVILTLVYYECPNLCNYMLNGFVKSLKKVDWTAGEKFEIVTVSINPKETPQLAKQKKAAYLAAYGRPLAESGWHFLTGDEDQIGKLAKEVGFGFKYDPREKQYGHAAALFMLTPTGKISRYLYGIEFKNKDLRLALLEASNGKIGNVIDRFLLFCFRYDPETRKYSIYSLRLMEAGCAGTVVAFGGYLALFWRRQRKGA